ncbi:MAG TPA: DUF5808 domain-containing protein [Thermomicrobiales bacterium]|jgi:hypothetical protein|nr:hypothetical protein [Chloroflexota bacterium]HQX62324.1 DUF5808 domain-containing protein [Thermomicrobiales bacterium]
MMRRIRRLAGIALAVVVGVALVDQLGRAPEDRDWHGEALGVPYDFRLPTPDRVRQRAWNREDERVLVPRVWGVGWTINVRQFVRRLGLLIA